MIKVEFSKRFLKDLKRIEKLQIYSPIKQFCFDEIYSYDNFFEVNNLKKIVGYKNYYRIRFAEYRIGIKYEKNTIIFMRVLHRKEIYKNFP